jgi:predicted MFS family arabinose efflux permease
MSFTVTIMLLVLGIAVFAGANFMSRRPVEPGNPSLIPWTALQFVGLVMVILMLAHLVTLLSGTPLQGRYAADIFPETGSVG